MSTLRLLVCVPLLALLLAAPARTCTIFSGQAPDGATWIGNNEDFIFDFDTYLNVYPREGAQLGVLTFTYDRPQNFIQGGVNEKGLFFDANAVPAVDTTQYAGWKRKRNYPGGDSALTMHILRTCSTVPQMVAVLDRYRLPSLLGGQLHVADAEGNLAIIDADSVRVVRGGPQVTTNFDCLTRPEAAAGCWRFPLVERMLDEGGVGLESFARIAEATQQPRSVSTIYTTIVDLRAGDFYLYYGGDYRVPARFRVRDMLAKGRRSYLMRSLLPDAPITRMWEVFRAKGPAEAVAWLRGRPGLTDERRAEILRYAFLNRLLIASNYPVARAFYAEWAALAGDRHVAGDLFAAYARMSEGDLAGAAERLARQVAADSASTEIVRRMYLPAETALLARLRGQKAEGANARFELKGHRGARYVCVYGLGLSAFTSPLLRTKGGWAGDFALPSGPIAYGFVVDGKLIRDPANPRHEMAEGIDRPHDLSVRVVR
ncbi:MAG TPA: hypothetical protein VMS88_06245 [Terriglobales bacterium]|nr:hypothetical protein [Terriglobales bacterium]